MYRDDSSVHRLSHIQVVTNWTNNLTVESPTLAVTPPRLEIIRFSQLLCDCNMKMFCVYIVCCVVTSLQTKHWRTWWTQQLKRQNTSTKTTLSQKNLRNLHFPTQMMVNILCWFVTKMMCQKQILLELHHSFNKCQFFGFWWVFVLIGLSWCAIIQAVPKNQTI